MITKGKAQGDYRCIKINFPIWSPTHIYFPSQDHSLPANFQECPIKSTTHFYSHPSGAPPTALTPEEPHLPLSPQRSPTYCSYPGGAPPTALLLSPQAEEPYCSHPRQRSLILLSPQWSPTYCSHPRGAPPTALTYLTAVPPTALTSLRPTHSCWPQELLLYSQSYYRRIRIKCPWFGDIRIQLNRGWVLGMWCLPTH